MVYHPNGNGSIKYKRKKLVWGRSAVPEQRDSTALVQVADFAREWCLRRLRALANDRGYRSCDIDDRRHGLAYAQLVDARDPIDECRLVGVVHGEEI